MDVSKRNMDQEMDSEEKNQPDMTEKVNRKSEKSKSSSIGFWSIAIPAYCYFFGYSSLKYKLEGLGFDSPDIPTAPGDVYFHAFDAFVFLGSKTIPASREMIIKHFDENWGFVSLLSIGVILVAYILQLIVDRNNMASVLSEPIPEKPSHWLKRYLIQIKNAAQKIARWSWTVLSGKGTVHSLWISRSLFLGALVFAGFFIMMPAILAIMTFMALVLIPPPLIGEQMAKAELKEFNCPDNTLELITHPECSLITLKDGKEFIGIVYAKDSKFLYLLAKDTAKTIAIDQVTQGNRKVVTGKIKRPLSIQVNQITESLYCHQSTAPFDSSLLLKPPTKAPATIAAPSKKPEK